jgi:hypothetical protein
VQPCATPVASGGAHPLDRPPPHPAPSHLLLTLTFFHLLTTFLGFFLGRIFGLVGWTSVVIAAVGPQVIIEAHYLPCLLPFLESLLLVSSSDNQAGCCSRVTQTFNPWALISLVLCSCQSVAVVLATFEVPEDTYGFPVIGITHMQFSTLSSYNHIPSSSWWSRSRPLAGKTTVACCWNKETKIGRYTVTIALILLKSVFHRA